MDLKEKMAQISELMVKTKEEWVESGPENTDLSIYLHFWRGDDLIAAVVCPLDRDKGMQAGRLGATGFNADTMAITFESFHTSLKESPITGKPWVPREMQFVVENYPEAVEKGWVNECITITIHERGGAFALDSRPYVIKDGKVEWKEGQFIESVEGDTGGGMMFAYLQDAMTGPTIIELMESEAEKNPIVSMMANLVDDDEVRFFHADVATYKALGERDLAIAVVLTADPGSKREEWLTERLGPPGTPYSMDQA